MRNCNDVFTSLQVVRLTKLANVSSIALRGAIPHVKLNRVNVEAFAATNLGDTTTMLENAIRSISAHGLIAHGSPAGARHPATGCETTSRSPSVHSVEILPSTRSTPKPLCCSPSRGISEYCSGFPQHPSRIPLQLCGRIHADRLDLATCLPTETLDPSHDRSNTH